MPRGKVIVGRHVGSFSPPNLAKWKELEKSLGKPLPPELRVLINKVAQVFAWFGPCADKAMPRHKLDKAISKWRSQTQKLRSVIWTSELGTDGIIPASEITQEWLQRTFGKLARQTRADAYPLEYLAIQLEAAMATVDFVIQVTDRARSATPKDLWEVWVVLVAILFKRWGLRTTAGSGDKQASDSPFVLFVEGYQRLLPSECRRYSAAPSIAKGIQKARKRFARTRFDALMYILVHWSFGFYSIKPSKKNRDLAHAIIEFNRFKAVFAQTR